MKGVKNRGRGCEAVAERIDISSKLSIYSLLDLHKLRWSVSGVSERQHAYPGQLLATTCIVDSLITTALQFRAISCMRVPIIL